MSKQSSQNSVRFKLANGGHVDIDPHEVGAFGAIDQNYSTLYMSKGQVFHVDANEQAVNALISGEASPR